MATLEIHIQIRKMMMPALPRLVMSG